jgi:uncharacterized protein YbaR (Trm112 family)
MSLPPAQFDPAILDQLACPACLGNLRLQQNPSRCTQMHANGHCCSDSALDDVRLVCASCRRAYPIVDGIPALIMEQAKPSPGA